MDRKRGLAGWRWLFIIDFLITLSKSVFMAFLCFPGSPDNMKASFFFSEEELIMAKARLPPRKETKLDLSVFKRVIGRWHWWLFSLLWVFGGENESFATNSLFLLFG